MKGLWVECFLLLFFSFASAFLSCTQVHFHFCSTVSLAPFLLLFKPLILIFENLGEWIVSFALSCTHNYKCLFFFSLHDVLAASSWGDLLSFGLAPVTTVLKCRGEGPYGVGRPQQASGYVCKWFNLHVHAPKCMHILTSYSLLSWEVSSRSLKLGMCVCVCVSVINPLSKDSLSC